MNEKEIIEREKLYEDFQEEFPLERLKNLTIDEYTNLDKETSFCYWLEFKTEILGSIRGGSAYKFGIYKWNNPPTAQNGVGKDNNYAWYSRYGNTANEAYENVHKAVLSIAENASKGAFSEIDKIDLGDVYKWKIAFLYSHKNLLSMYEVNGLKWIAKKEGLGISKPKISEIQKFLMDKKGEENIFEYGERLWANWLSSEEYKKGKEKNKNQTETQGDTDMSNANDKIKHYTKLLQTNHNLILTGAPGTGKTHLAKEIASLLCFGCVKDENEMTDEDKKQIGFVQFHPSYDYTDFVEGLRPDPDNDGSKDVSFIRMDGVFKEFCKRTLSKQKITKGNFDDAYEKFIEEIIENEEFSLNTKSRNKKFMLSLNSKNSVCVTAIDGNSSMCITKERIKQYIETGKTNWYIYTEPIGDYIKRKYNIKVEQKVETNKKKKFVFIIDEINRGEISKIFGELFFSIDPGYRGGKGKVQTQYQNLVEDDDDFFDGFYVPENVYIIGTMNDIDRSVESMDFAFRRRFAFCEIMASENIGMLDALGDLKDDAINRMERLNKKIEQIEGLSSAYHIGASYFLKLQNYDGDFEQLWEYHIKGLLYEYLRGNPEIETLVSNLKSAYDLKDSKQVTDDGSGDGTLTNN